MLRVSQNRELKKIFGPKRVEIERGWRKLHNEELHDLHTTSNIIKGGKMGRACGIYGEEEKQIRVFVGKPEGKK